MLDKTLPFKIGYGKVCIFTATPSTGYEVSRWHINGIQKQTGGNTFILDNVTEDSKVSVEFRPRQVKPISCIMLKKDEKGKKYWLTANGEWQEQMEWGKNKPLVIPVDMFKEDTIIEIRGEEEVKK